MWDRCIQNLRVWLINLGSIYGPIIPFKEAMLMGEEAFAKYSFNSASNFAAFNEKKKYDYRCTRNRHDLLIEGLDFPYFLRKKTLFYKSD
jgi:hypothetical protein